MNSLFFRILIAGLIVGTLDISSAFIHVLIKTGQFIPAGILKFVASGAFGQEAFTGGNIMVVAGLLFHYSIAFAFTTLFFLLFPKVKILSKNIIVTGILYGIFVWSIMNLIIVPSSNIPHKPFDIFNALINVVILIVCVGLPLSFMANNYYKKIEA